MGSAGGSWEKGDKFDPARLEQKSLFVGTGAAISGLGTTYAGQLAYCTETGSGFTINHLYEMNAANTTWIDSNIGGVGIYGDGNDGAVTISGNTSLTRDMYYSTLTVDSGVTLTPSGYRIFASTSVTVNGTISAKGGNASGITAGTAVGSGTLGGGTDGGAGKSGEQANGNSSSALTNSLGGRGGSGGNGGSYTGGVSGTITAPTAASGSVRHLPNAINLYLFPSGTLTSVKGGTGGGGGACDASVDTPSSGAGGAGGGVMMICAPTITVSGTGTVTSKGGDGSAGSGTNGWGGGGGGGGGGIIMLIYSIYSNSGTVTVAGGALGAGYPSATENGVAGNSGSLIQITN